MADEKEKENAQEDDENEEVVDEHAYNADAT